MVAYMARIMRMPISQLWHDSLQRIQQIKVSTRIQISSSQASTGVQQTQLADASWPTMFLNQRLNPVSQINHLFVLVSLDLNYLHVDNDQLTLHKLWFCQPLLAETLLYCYLVPTPKAGTKHRL